MRMRILGITLVIFSGLAPWHAWAQTTTDNPVGVWRTFDDHTGLERGAIRIREQDGTLTGTIVGTVDPKSAGKTCDLCEGEQKGKPILGLTIMTGLRRDGDHWTGGRILDPETGSVYRCSMRLEDGGQTLVMRGYIGISLLGRSQTWKRKE